MKRIRLISTLAIIIGLSAFANASDGLSSRRVSTEKIATNLSGEMAARDITLAATDDPWTQKHGNKPWTNGGDFFIAQQMDGYINFSGGSLHEGGSCFGLTPEGDHYRLRGGFFMADENRPPQGNGSIALNGSVGDRVEIRHFGTAGAFMIVYNDKNQPTEVLHPTDDLRTTLEADIVKYYLAGEYRTTDNSTILFYPDRKEVEGLAHEGYPGSYTLGQLFGTPTNIIIFDYGYAYRLEKTDEGTFSLCACRYNEEDDEWDYDTICTTMRRVSSLADKGEAPGDYPFTALRPMTRGQLSLFNRRELRLMRNEIFARHGMRFRSPDLKKHFEAQTWYSATTDNVNDKLTEIERINIEMIQQVEKDMNAK